MKMIISNDIQPEREMKRKAVKEIWRREKKRKGKKGRKDIKKELLYSCPRRRKEGRERRERGGGGSLCLPFPTS